MLKAPLNTHKDVVYIFVDEFFLGPLTLENENSTFLREVGADYARVNVTPRRKKS
jgi:hypothetical protein